jgi:type I restriction enzyme S subunit
MNRCGAEVFQDTPLGTIAADWEMGVVGDFVAALQAGVSVNAIETDSGCVGSDVGVLKTSAVSKGKFLARQHKVVVPDDTGRVATSVIGDRIIISRMNTPALVGESGYVRESVPHLFLPDRLWQTLPSERPHSQRWLSYWLQHPSTRRLIAAGATGTSNSMKNISKETVLSLPIPRTPLPEQEKIAAILTAVDDKLDVIARQIEVTQTLKQGLMQTLFSQGVGTQEAAGRWARHIEFKDSELGEIPVAWQVKSLEELADSITVGIATSTTEHYVEGGVPLIRNQNIKEDFLDMSDLLQISDAFDGKNKSKRVQAGDILTVRTGYPGVSCVVPDGLGFLQTFTTLITRPNRKLISPHFVSRYFNSPQGKGLMLHQAAGGAQQNINAGNLKKLLVPVPSLDEQRRIAEILAAADSKCRSLASKKRHYQSLKRGLMQKLLTGEWRVSLGMHQDFPIAA